MPLHSTPKTTAATGKLPGPFADDSDEDADEDEDEDEDEADRATHGFLCRLIDLRERHNGRDDMVRVRLMLLTCAT